MSDKQIEFCLDNVHIKGSGTPEITISNVRDEFNLLPMQRLVVLLPNGQSAMLGCKSYSVFSLTSIDGRSLELKNGDCLKMTGEIYPQNTNAGLKEKS